MNVEVEKKDLIVYILGLFAFLEQLTKTLGLIHTEEYSSSGKLASRC